ncbi:MFS transporter, partial [Pseudomonas syringae]
GVFRSGGLGGRSVVWLNLPLGVSAWFCAGPLVPWYRPQGYRPHSAGAIRLDWLGALLIVLTLGSLQLFVEWRGQRSLSVSLTCGAVTLAAMLGLWFHERRWAFALLPAGLFANPSIRLLFILSLSAGALMVTLPFYLPLLLQGSYGSSPQDAGRPLTPLAP